MTGPTRADHLDLDALADALAGQRRDERHLRACASCSERLAELAGAEVEVAACLAGLAPPSLPEGLAERLAAALQAEADRTAALPAAGPLVLPTRRRPRRQPPPWLPAVAASLVLVLAAGVGIAVLRGPGDSTAGSDASGGLEAGGAGPGADLAAVPRLRSGADYADEAQRAAAVPALLAGAQAAPSEQVDAALQRLQDPEGLAGCLAALRSDGGPDGPPLALDDAAYDGAPALAVLWPAADADALVLTVVGTGCSEADPDVRLRTRVDRP